MPRSKPKPEPPPQIARLPYTPQAELASFRSSTRCWRGFQTTWDICLVDEGISEWRYRGKTMSSPPGSVRLKEPGETFRTLSVKQASSMQLLRVSHEYVQTLLDPWPSSRLYLTTFQFDAPHLFQRSSELFQVLKHSQNKLEQETHLAEGLSSILLHHLALQPKNVPVLSHPGVKKAREYIDAYFAEEITLEQLAQIAGLHPVYLSRVFRKEVGLPPHAYQNERRLLAALSMLEQGMSPVDTAVNVGFVDQSHLTRQFKRQIGLTPGAFRRISSALQLPTTNRVLTLTAHAHHVPPKSTQPST